MQTAAALPHHCRRSRLAINIATTEISANADGHSLKPPTTATSTHSTAAATAKIQA